MLLSCGLGALATGVAFDLRFTGWLGFIEWKVKAHDFHRRLAAVTVAIEMAKHEGQNAHAIAHFEHYRQHFRRCPDCAREQLD